MSASDTEKYLEKAIAVGSNTVGVSVVKDAKISFISHYSPFENVSIGDVFVESVVSLLGESVVLTKTQGAQLSKSAKDDSNSWSFDNSIYEVILELPGSGKYQWLDLYYGENVNFKNEVNTKTDENWKWSYSEDDRVLQLSTIKDDAEIVSKYIIEREPSMHIFNTGDINPRTYGARNIVERNGEVVSDKLTSLILHPTARCEYYVDDLPPCSFEVFQPATVSKDDDGKVKDADLKFWFDTSLGSLKLGSEYEGQNFVYIGDVADASSEIKYNDFRIFTLESNSACEELSDAGLCFTSSANKKVADTPDKDSWLVGDEL